MATSPSTSYTLSPPPPPSPLSPLYTPIPEHHKPVEPSPASYKHRSTPLHPKTEKPTTPAVDWSISCNKCRPSPRRDKTSIVPFSPSILRSLFRVTPRSSTSSAVSTTAAADDQWKLAAAEISRKLLHATRKRDEALLETSRLKYTVAELERQLESRAAGAVSDGPGGSLHTEQFLRAVADSRSAIRHLCRALAAQIRHGAAGPRAMDRAMALLQPYSIRVAETDNDSKSHNRLFYLEALLNKVFYSEFEADEGTAPPDPGARCEAARAALEAVRGVGWEEVLSKGTRHYSEGLSRFCDRRMSEVVGVLGWARAWPEALLQAFFGAAKGAWVVHLLARTVHPQVPILRVEPRARFEAGYMDDVGADRERRVATTVRMMVAPGFYVYSGSSCGVVKCKVLCLYSSDMGNGDSEPVCVDRVRPVDDTRDGNTCDPKVGSRDV